MIYILEFDHPIGDPANPRSQAQFYVGYAEDSALERRIAQHKAGQGAKITAAAVRSGRVLKLVATLHGDRHLERRIKQRHDTPALMRSLRAGRV